jgi:hypothetical protein
VQRQKHEGTKDAMATNDPEFYQAPKYAPESQQPPRQRGCFFYGCIIASILMVLVLILVGLGVYFGYRFFTQLVEQYTATAPRELPKVAMPADQRTSLQKRVEEFGKAVEDGKTVEPLVLTGDDLNALIEEAPAFAELKGKVYVKIEGDELKGQVSFPLEKFGLAMLKGRYLNGEADLKASLNNGVLIVTLDSIEVNGKRVPEEAMTNLRQENLAKDAYKNPKHAEILRKLESLEINDGKIIIKVRAKAAETSLKQAEKGISTKVEALDSEKKESPRPEQTSPSKPATEPADSPVPKR